MPENEMWKPRSSARLRDVPGLGEAVHDAARLAGALLAHDRKRVGGGGARVDDERLAAGPRRADVRAKALRAAIRDRR